MGVAHLFPKKSFALQRTSKKGAILPLGLDLIELAGNPPRQVYNCWSSASFSKKNFALGPKCKKQAMSALRLDLIKLAGNAAG